MVPGGFFPLLSFGGGFQAVFGGGGGGGGVAAGPASPPAGALLDIEMPGLDGLAAAAALRAQLPACRILILTTFSRPGYLRRAMEAGAYGYLLKDAPATQLA